MKNISPLYKFSLKGGGWDEQRQPKVQPSAEIVRVECAKCRRECDSPGARATLCGDRACRVREMQARAPRAGCPRNPLRRSCVSSARNAGESAIGAITAQPSGSCVPSARNAGESAIRLAAEQAVEVEAENWGLCSTTSVRGVAGELEAENWRRGRTTVVRGVAGEREDENWRVGSTTGVRGVSGELEAENWRVSSTT